MSDYKIFREKMLSDPDVLKEYENHKAEYEIARALIKARVTSNLTQADVAKRMHTSQAHIARLESGYHFPNLLSVYRYAQAVGQKISLHITP